MKIIPIIIAILTIHQVFAFNVLFMGQVNRGFFFGVNIPDCYLAPGPTTVINPYFGVTATAMIVQNANTTAVINALGGNPVSVTERCLPNGNLAEIGCSIAYSGYPDDYVGALEYAPTDLITSTPLRCEMYKTLSPTAVLEKPAFFHRSVPNTSYVQPGTPGPIVTITSSCPTVSIMATPSSPTRQINNIWIESAPVQNQNPVIFSQLSSPCQVGAVCSLSSVILQPGTAHIFVSEFSFVGSTITSVDSVRC